MPIPPTSSGIIAAEMTSRSSYLFALGLFALLASGIVAMNWFDAYVGDTGLHGSIAFVIAVPFVILFGVGAVILAVAVFKAHLRSLPTFIGLLPIAVLVVVSFGIALVLLTG
jgi:hypothetical protein